MKNQDTDLQLECLSNQRQIDTEFNSIPSGHKKESLRISVTERLPENDFNCIVTEAERYINSVWHDMKEKLDFKKLPVLLKHKSGAIHFIDSTPTSWKYLIKHYVKWVYIRDLLPNEEK